MSERSQDPIVDDKELDEYLKGDSIVSQRYRAGENATPPSELDRRVLEMARESLRTKASKARVWMRWTAPLAVAASAVLVLSIVMDAGVRERAAVSTVTTAARQRPEIAASTPAPIAQEGAGGSRNLSEERPQFEAAPPATFAPPQDVAPGVSRQSTPPGEGADEKARLNASGAELGRRSEEDRASARASSDPDAAAPRSSVEQIVVTGRSVRSAVQESPAAVDSIVADRIRAPPAPRIESVDPERWLQDIRELRKRGDAAGADGEWERFRRAYPDYEVAASDPARKQD